MKKIIVPKGAARPRSDYSHGVLVKPGYLLFIAGQTARGPDGTIAGIGDPYTQAKRVYENIAAVLSEAGSSFSDIVKMTTYITDISYREEVHKVRREYFRQDFPANTLIVVKSLAHPDYLVEVEAIACLNGE